MCIEINFMIQMSRIANSDWKKSIEIYWQSFFRTFCILISFKQSIYLKEAGVFLLANEVLIKKVGEILPIIFI